jgi:hypothetical protein
VTAEERAGDRLADAELARRRQLWNVRVSDVNGSTALHAFAISREALEPTLSALLFDRAGGINRNAEIRVELEPFIALGGQA